MLLPAAKELRATIENLQQQGRYVPTSNVPEESYSSTGWPTFSKSWFRLNKGAPVNWMDTYSDGDAKDGKLGISELPKMKELYAFVDNAIAEERIAPKHIAFMGLVDLDLDRDIKLGIRSLVSRLLHRACAIGCDDDLEYLDIYRELEMVQFSDELLGDVVMPLALLSFESIEPVNIYDQIWLEPLSKSDHFARALDSQQQVGDAHYLVAAAATHSLVFKNVTFPNFFQDFYLRGERLFDQELAQADLFASCLWTTCEAETGVAQILVRPKGWSYEWIGDNRPLHRVREVRNYPPRFDEGGWLEEKRVVGIEQLEKTKVAFEAIRSDSGSMRLAANRLRRSAFRTDFQDRVIDVSVGIEALLAGSGDRTELTHRYSERAAMALANDFDPQTIYSSVKKFYGVRSKIVHGDQLKTEEIRVNDLSFNSSDIGMFLLRSLLNSKIEQGWDPSTLDERILQSMSTPNGVD